MASARYRVPLLLFLGMILMQSAWILALPPFRGIDEVDHAYRAAAVGDGQWMPEFVPATDGRGDLLIVPKAIVKAAEPVCASYEYTGRDNCHAVEELGDGKVEVASAAARYNPVFYWMIGAPASEFEGAQSLYAMRIVGAVLCSLFLALAGWALTLWTRTRWPLVALLLAMTPVAVYSTAIAAPNGIEMGAALAVWAALLGLTRNAGSKIERLLLYAAIPAAVVLAGVRTLGPLWLALILLSIVLLLGVKQTIQLARCHAVAVAVASAIVGIALICSVWWTATAGANSLATMDPERYSAPLLNSLKQVPLWFFQSIAAFPTRNEQAPTLVYACGTLLILALVGVALGVADARLRIAIAGTFLVAVAVPFCLTLITYSRIGDSWQGRYGLPYSFGLMLVASLALEKSGFRHRLLGPVLVGGWLALITAHTVGVTMVLISERSESPLSGDPSWATPAPWMVVALMLVAGLAWAAALRRPDPPAGLTGRTDLDRDAEDMICHPASADSQNKSLGREH